MQVGPFHFNIERFLRKSLSRTSRLSFLVQRRSCPIHQVSCVRSKMLLHYYKLYVCHNQSYPDQYGLRYKYDLVLDCGKYTAYSLRRPPLPLPAIYFDSVPAPAPGPLSVGVVGRLLYNSFFSRPFGLLGRPASGCSCRPITREPFAHLWLRSPRGVSSMLLD